MSRSLPPLLSATRRALYLSCALACAAVSGLSGCAHPGAGASGADGTTDGTLLPLSVLRRADYAVPIDQVLRPDAPDYDSPLVPWQTQQAWTRALRERYVGTAPEASSPWNPRYVERMIERPLLPMRLRARADRYDNAGKPARRIGYGVNFQPHDAAWIARLRASMRVEQFGTGRFDAARRAITLDEASVRELPTDDAHFYDMRLPGQGFPFDNLQITALRPGTPVYRLGDSADGAWSYVLAPEVEGWVRANRLAQADEAFVNGWRAAMAAPGAVLAARLPVHDANGRYLFDAPLGTILPLAVPAPPGTSLTVRVPVADAEGHATMHSARLAAGSFAALPVPLTRHAMADLIRALDNRPYGWGNSFGDNDCSAETRSLFAPFGLWLPRHSSAQVDVLRPLDLSQQTPAQRLAILRRDALPLLTLIDIGGHVMLYLGAGQRAGRPIAWVYQNIWGLRPPDGSRRAVLGGSLVFALDTEIPGDASLQSLAARGRFRLGRILPLGEPPAATPADGDDVDQR